MSIAWLAPAALAGLGLVALPIAIHLLVRHHARRLPYPSLRFLRETQLAAFRRRTIQDAPLLACRIAMVALAALALAGPVLQTPSRTAGYADRMSRAVIALEGADDTIISSITGGAFASTAFRRLFLSDALADAARWLDAQPKSSREIVIAGVLRRGSVSDGDLADIPKEIGIRFVPVEAASSNDVAWPILMRRDGVLSRVDRSVHLDVDATRVADGPVTTVKEDLVSILAEAKDVALAEGALGAALDAGLPWPDFDRRVVIVWEGADPSVVSRIPPPARVIRMPVPSPPSASADAVLAALGESSLRRNALEPVMITPEQYLAWTRRPGPPGDGGPPADEGDRRWLWAGVLVLLGVEGWMRRTQEAPVV